MATLYFSVYRDAKEVALGGVLEKDTVTIGAGSLQTTVIATVGNVMVRLATDTACQIERGTNPTANATSEFMPANSVEYFGMRDGQRVAVIQQQ